jgi:hypothetical protein
LYFFCQRPVPGIAAASVSYPAFAELSDRDQDWQECGDASRRTLRPSVPVPVCIKKCEKTGQMHSEAERRCLGQGRWEL